MAIFSLTKNDVMVKSCSWWYIFGCCSARGFFFLLVTFVNVFSFRSCGCVTCCSLYLRCCLFSRFLLIFFLGFLFCRSICICVWGAWWYQILRNCKIHWRGCYFTIGVSIFVFKMLVLQDGFVDQYHNRM